VLVLAAPATAAAWGTYQTQTAKGTDTSHRQLAKGCTSHRDSTGNGLLISCDKASGSAVVRYVFSVPSSAGTIWYHANTQSHYTSGKVTWSGRKLSKTQVRISARLTGVSRVHIYSVFISYYR
jgi:Multicopper oxidase